MGKIKPTGIRLFEGNVNFAGMKKTILILAGLLLLPAGIFATHNRAGEITIQRLLNYELKDADVIIRPDVGKLHWTDFSRVDYLEMEGERSAREAVGKIDRALPFYLRWAKNVRKLFTHNKSVTR